MLISLAVDYHAADVSTRERFHIPQEHHPRLYERLSADGVSELAMLATCNRTELYAWCPTAHPAEADVHYHRLAKRWASTESAAESLLGVASRRTHLEVARHAIRVAVGLESQILGDGQILGQFRSAYQAASEASGIGNVLHRLFETALRAGKRAHAETGLGSGRNSVGAQAAALAARRFGTLTHTRIVVVGCGKTGERVARQLVKHGARDLVLMNRTKERADLLASELGARSAPLETVHAEIAMADIAIVATGAEGVLVEAFALARARVNCATSTYQLLIIDLAMPRNVEASAASLAGLTLVDLDAMRPDVSATEQQRRASIPAAEAIVDEELHGFTEWLAIAAAREAIRPLREALADVCRREVAYAAGEEVAARVTERIVSKVLAMPMAAARGASARGEPLSVMTQAMQALFARPMLSLSAADGPARAVANTD
ncbi:MAG: glutamyl-tRNA reductase [Gemmatimonadota bacterium]